MTDDHRTVLDSLSETRRSVLKKGALASGALALGGTGAAAAQQTETDDDGGIFGDDPGGEALVQQGNFFPNANFTFESGVVAWTPNVPDVRDSLWDDYNTYHIRWLNTNEIAPLWVSEDATVGEYDEDLGFIPDPDADSNQPQLWEMEQEFAPFGDNEYLMEVEFEPVDEGEVDGILENDDWWQDVTDDGNGDATGTASSGS